MSVSPRDVTHLRESAPYSAEAEQSLLGAILLDQKHCGSTVRAGGVDLFNDPLHAEIFRILQKKDAAGQLVSPVTMADAMRGSAALAEVGGPGYLARVAGSAPGASRVPGYIAMLSDLMRKRGIATAISEAGAAIAKGEDPASLIAGRLEAALVAAQGQDEATGPVSMLKAVSVAMEQVRDAFEGKESSIVKTGIPKLDEIISGFYPGELILLGGRPSMGKTGVALAVALNAARAGHGVCIASLEMNPEAMALRALSEATANARNAVYYSKMRRGDMTDPQVTTLQGCAAEVAALPITFLPRHFADIGALMAGAKQAHRTTPGGIRILIIDYVQLIQSQAKGRYEQITEISIALKRLAGQLNVPVLALSQLSRSLEQRDEKRPTLSDLRESGQLEQDADTVLFCYRDEYYLERSQPKKEADLEAWQGALDRAKNRLEIIVAKQRQGEVRTAHVRFNPATNLIWEEY